MFKFSFRKIVICEIIIGIMLIGVIDAYTRKDRGAIPTKLQSTIDTKVILDKKIDEIKQEEALKELELQAELEVQTVSGNIPQGYGNFKSYMDYEVISNTDSYQYQLQQKAKTGDYGIRYYNNLPMVAVSSAIGSVGSKINVTFSTGKTYSFVVGDIKGGTDFASADGSVIEFIVDTDQVPDYILNAGSYGVVYEGTVVDID